MASDIVGDAKRWLDVRNGRVSKHGENCHQWHAECLVARLVAELERSSRDDHGLAVTCPASRHAELIAEELIEHGSCGQLADEGKHAGRSILSAVRSLYAARAEIARLVAEVERHRMTPEERGASGDAIACCELLATVNDDDVAKWHTERAMMLRALLDRTAPKEVGRE